MTSDILRASEVAYNAYSAFEPNSIQFPASASSALHRLPGVLRLSPTGQRWTTRSISVLAEVAMVIVPTIGRFDGLNRSACMRF